MQGCLKPYARHSRQQNEIDLQNRSQAAGYAACHRHFSGFIEKDLPPPVYMQECM